MCILITREQLTEALQELTEPVSGQSFTSLQWIRDVMIKPDNVSLTILLSPDAADSQVREQLITDAKSRLALYGVEQAHIRLRLAAEQELIQAGLQEAGGSTMNQDPHAPQGHGAALDALSPLLHPDSRTTFIAVASGKGGVGKSTVTVNLAVALARLGKKVGLIDADIYGFSVPDMMGIEDRPAVVDERVVPIERFGVQIMSMGFFVEDNSPVVWRGPMLGKMLRNFFAEVAWGERDVVLLDLPPGTGDVALDIHQMIPHSKEIIVTTPHGTAAFVAARAGTMAMSTNHEIIGVVENMAYMQCGSCGEKEYVFGRGGGGKLAEALHAPLLAQIPLGAADNHPQEPDFSPSVYKADHPIGQLYLELAQSLIDKGQV